MRRILLFGAAGQLGADLVRAFDGDELITPSHDRVNVVDSAVVSALIEETRPAVVVSAAAFHDVDRCEDQPELPFDVNALGARNVAAAAARVSAMVVFISTDYVFSGELGRAYVESDRTDPVNVYGVSKLAGETLVRNANPNHLIVRTAALYGSSPCRGKGAPNFVELMLRLGEKNGVVRVVDSETVSPSYTLDVAKGIRAAVDDGRTGLLHVASAGAVNWNEFAREIFSAAKLNATVEVAGADEFPKKAPRPAFSALATGTDAPPLPGWREGLRAYLDEVL